MKILVTGGAGFIGSALIRYLITETDHHVVNVDKLTYAANLESLAEAADSDRYAFEKLDICDGPAVATLFERHRPDAIMHLAAESHVDRSLEDPAAFLQTNVVGTCALLEASLAYWADLPQDGHAAFRFHHVSTDEVYGSLGETGDFTEETAYRPNSPYSASKAASDHFVRAWHQTYGLPVVVSNASNNYGPHQFPEKLIPLMILNALEGRSLPVYGRGENVRDWLHVEDHVCGLLAVLKHGRLGETYNIGGHNEQRNIDVVYRICDLVDELAPPMAAGPRRDLVTFVEDRPGHDLRYAIDATKIERELGWRPTRTFNDGLRETVRWYLDHRDWWRPLLARYNRQRLGLGRNAPAAAGGGA